MGVALFCGASIAVFVSIYLAAIYNDLVVLKHEIAALQGDMHSLIAQRHDELPKLVDFCRSRLSDGAACDQVLARENAVYQVYQMASAASLGEAETALRKVLGRFFQLTAGQPSLLQEDRYRYLQQRVGALQLTLADRRERYNTLVTRNNIRVERFPDLWIARRFDFKTLDRLYFQEEEMQDLEIKGVFI